MAEKPKAVEIIKRRDYTPPTWHYRIGPWRFFFEIDGVEGIVYMLTFSHRSSAY